MWKTVLGYAAGNTSKNIERKFRTLSKQLHPNKNPALGPKPFQALREALGEARQYYENQLHRRNSPPPPRRNSPSPPRRQPPPPRRNSPPPPRRQPSPPRRQPAPPRRQPAPSRRWAAINSNNNNNNNNTNARANARSRASASAARFSPYVLPTPPQVPVYRVGLTARPFRGFPQQQAAPAPFRAPRSIVPRAGTRMRPRQVHMPPSQRRNNNNNNNTAVPMNWE
jgi:hypothetical protein